MKRFIIILLFAIFTTSVIVQAQDKFIPYLSFESSISVYENFGNWDISMIGNVHKNISIILSEEHYNNINNLLFGLEYKPKIFDFNKISLSCGGKFGFNSKDVPIDEKVDVVAAYVVFIKEEIKINSWFGLCAYQRICFNREDYFENRIGIFFKHK